MAFCRNCGQPLSDGATFCAHCGTPTGEAQQPVQQPVQQPAKSGNTFFTNLFGTIKTYIKNPKKAVAERVEAKDFITPSVFVGVLFLALVIANSCMFGKIAVSLSILGAGGIFNFGFVVLAALIETIVMCAVYVGASFGLKMINKKSKSAADAFFSSYIAFGINSLVVSALIITGGLFFLWTSVIAQIFYGIAALWLVIVGLNDVKAEDENGSFVKTIITAAIVFAALFIYILFYRLAYVMNLQGASVHMVGAMSDMYSMASRALSSLGGLF